MTSLAVHAFLRPYFGPQPANAAALVLTSLMNTALNRRLTFKITERHRMKRDHLNGLIVILVALLLTGGSLGVLHWINPAATVPDELWTTTIWPASRPPPCALPCCGTGFSAAPGTANPTPVELSDNVGLEGPDNDIKG